MRFLFSLIALLIIAGCQTEPSETEKLAQWLEQPAGTSRLQEQPFATESLSKEEADSAISIIHQYLQNKRMEEYASQWQEKNLTDGIHYLKFVYKKFGEKPAGGWSLYISMHGGGKQARR